MRYIYLHGFASGPTSNKAAFLRERFASREKILEVPDLNHPDFTHMTLSTQLQKVHAWVGDSKSRDQILFIGSSMGGLLATLACRDRNDVSGLVLMAPGFGIEDRWPALLGTKAMDAWRLSGSHDFFHYSYNREVPLRYQFIEDLHQYQTSHLAITCPAVVFHGRDDEVVPVAESIRFQQRNPNLVDLRILAGGHDLLGQLEKIWDLTVEFIKKGVEDTIQPL